jgi:hypothetical protein
MRVPIRRLLLLPAAGLVVLAAPLLAQTPGELPAPETHTLALSADQEIAPPGWEREVRVHANLVGVTWHGDEDAAFTVETRTDGSGWTAVQLAGDDTAPDGGTADARRARTRPLATEPVWVGDADVVRVRVERGNVSDLEVAAVRSEQPAPPNDSAGAVGGLIGTDPGPGFALAALAVAVVLGAVALGWSPWRRHRTVVVAAMLGALVLSACAVPPPPPFTLSVAQPTMVMRSSWGGDLPWACDDESVGIWYEVRVGVVHHTVNSNSYAPGEVVGMLRAMWGYHTGTLGYCDIAYNFLIDRFGTIYEGRQGGITKAVIGAHTGGFNRASTGIAILGTLSDVPPTTASYTSLVNLLAWKLQLHFVNPLAPATLVAGANNNKYAEGTVVTWPWSILGHRDASATECPGNTMYAQMPTLRQDVVAKMNA